MTRFYLLWFGLWFYGGAQPFFAIFFENNLYWYSVFQVLMSVALAVATYLLILPVRTIFSRAPTLEEWLIGLLLVISFLSIVASPQAPGLRGYGFLASTASLAFCVMALLRIIDRPSIALMWMGKGFVLGALLSALAPLLVNEFDVFLQSRYGVDSLIHPNSIGFRAAIAFVFLVGGVRIFRRTLSNVFLLVFFFVVLLLTFSKTSLIAVSLVLVMWWLLLVPAQRSWRRTVIFLAMIVPVAMFWERLLLQINFYFENPELYASLTGRLPLWEMVLEVSKQSPFLGFGFSAFREVIAPYTQAWWLVEIVHAHNAYLTALLEVGLLGTSILIILVALFMLRILQSMKFRGSRVQTLWLMLSVVVLLRSITEGSFGTGGYEFALFSAMLLIGRAWISRPVETVRDAYSTSP